MASGAALHASRRPRVEGEVEVVGIEADVELVDVRALASQIEAVSVRLGGLEERLDGVEARLEGVEELVKQVVGEYGDSSRLVSIARLVGKWKMQTCRYCVRGMCYAWRVPENTKAEGLDIVEVDGVSRLRVASTPEFCALCPLYEKR
ncbi:MAG TPA: hypothetical protein EYH59_02900 [Pyrodictium sp.]|nr:hypothetical protein [Pyrodictium sp.]